MSFYIVRETPDEIIEKSIKYFSEIHTLNIHPKL
jgi:flagellar protein FlbD